MTVVPLVRQNEYLCEKGTRNKEIQGAPRPSSVARSCGFSSDDRGGFSSGGHRLSSLYRRTTVSKPWLTDSYLAVSFS